MIFVKVQTQSRDRKPKIFYLKANHWPGIFDAMRSRAINSSQQWHTVKLHAVSESEYNLNTHPQFNI